MYVFDTDTASRFLRGTDTPLVTRVLSVAPGLIFLPVIVAQEQLEGRLRVIGGLDPRRPQDSARLPAAYDWLLKSLSDLRRFTLLPYTPAAERIYQSFPPAAKRVGLHDCRIAATAIERGFVVVTRNRKDFAAIPQVTWEDWTERLD